MNRGPGCALTESRSVPFHQALGALPDLLPSEWGAFMTGRSIFRSNPVRNEAIDAIIQAQAGADASLRTDVFP